MYVYMSVTDVGTVSISDCACSLHVEVRILAVYAKYVVPPTKSMSAPKLQRRFRCKRMARQAFLKIIT